MQFFHTELIHNALAQTFAFIKLRMEGHKLVLTLDRPEKKNALHPHMVNEIAFALQFARENKEVWVVQIEAAGNVFCAGADLKAFMGMLGEFESSIPNPQGEILIGELFNKVHKPIITKVEGNVYAGGFFFLAGATYVLCNEGVKLGLPEVKRGLFPYQVMAALLRVIPRRKAIDWCIRGYDLPVETALEWGLITHITRPDSIAGEIEKLVTELSANSPTAIRMGLEALDHITPQASDHTYLMAMLQKSVATKDGQEGLKAFREKRPPLWTGE